MGKKRTPPHIVQMQAEGTKADRNLTREGTYEEAQELANKMPTFPPDKLMYIRNLVQKVLRKELDLEVLKVFIRLTNSYMELESVYPRAKMLSERRYNGK